MAPWWRRRRWSHWLEKFRKDDPAQNGGRKEVVFIETNVGDYQTLVASAKSGIEVVVLDSKQDGLSQIAQWAQTHTGYDIIERKF